MQCNFFFVTNYLINLVNHEKRVMNLIKLCKVRDIIKDTKVTKGMHLMRAEASKSIRDVSENSKYLTSALYRVLQMCLECGYFL